MAEEFSAYLGDARIAFSNIQQFVTCIPQLLSSSKRQNLGFAATVTCGVAQGTYKAIADILKTHGWEIKITDDSDKMAVDYAINGVSGAAIGAAVGAAVGFSILTYSAEVAIKIIPAPVLLILGVFVFAGMALGGAAGLQATHMGMRLTLCPLNPNHVKMEFKPE